MALIEGIGDEVLQFFVIVLLLFLALVAWWSTQISERPLIRTVLILERRGARQTEGEAAPAPSSPPPNEEEDKTGEGTPVEGAEAVSTATEDVDGLSSSVEGATASPPDTETLASSSEDTNELRPADNAQVRLRFRTYLTSNSAAPAEATSEEEAQIEEQASSLPPSEPIEKVRSQEASQKVPEATPVSEHSIRIRLKYLNDELKLVDGNLEERLGDFKQRHFSLELAGRKLVRLIFNGQVLGQDACTLGHYGLFDNCVVHCLVHQPRTPPPSPNLNARSSSQRPAALGPWPLKNVLLATLSFLLGLAWYGRYQYAQLYTATTTVALVGLTGIFTVSLIGLYMPELQ